MTYVDGQGRKQDLAEKEAELDSFPPKYSGKLIGTSCGHSELSRVGEGGG